jgi:hypothetical protein
MSTPPKCTCWFHEILIWSFRLNISVCRGQILVQISRYADCFTWIRLPRSCGCVCQASSTPRFTSLSTGLFLKQISRRLRRGRFLDRLQIRTDFSNFWNFRWIQQVFNKKQLNSELLISIKSTFAFHQYKSSGHVDHFSHCKWKRCGASQDLLIWDIS